MNLSILYRGPLASCNYGCTYCPFAKRRQTREEHEEDRAALERFVKWVAARTTDRISVLFTPWGEALIHRRYQRAFQTLTNLPHVEKVVAQTNLACRLGWVEACDKRSLALWTTYHPSEVSRAAFLAKCTELDGRGVRFSVGMVGLRETIPEVEAMRRALPAHITLWVNAYKRLPDYYSAEDIARLTAIDPLFPVNNRRYPSLGEACRCGHSVISVYGDGTAQRCHFIKEPLGSIYEPGFESLLKRSPCTNQTCHCHIGYVHMDSLNLYAVYGEGVLERVLPPGPAMRTPGGPETPE